MVLVYGIPNCDIVKKSINWFKEKKIPYEFHNFKTEGVSRLKLLEWINIAGLETVINKRSTTWRNLSLETQKKMADPIQAVEVAMTEMSIIKRPVVETIDGLIIGFNAHEYEKKFMI